MGNRSPQDDHLDKGFPSIGSDDLFRGCLTGDLTSDPMVTRPKNPEEKQQSRKAKKKQGKVEVILRRNSLRGIGHHCTRRATFDPDPHRSHVIPETGSFPRCSTMQNHVQYG